MFFTLPSQPMSPAEEAHLLLQTGCAPRAVDALLAFADRYRAGMTADAAQKNRKLGTRALLRIARRVAQFPDAADDLRVLLERAVLAEFLPATETMNLRTIFEETGIKKRSPAVSGVVLWGSALRDRHWRARGFDCASSMCPCIFGSWEGKQS